uniref:Uncharacterized protein n=1 Tax=Candidatus Kentrum sp. FW TaxID=2126338 RepID=A0A450RZC1_9GAMM|nr:MAG: hypothetical protein BECKFW1821A_GA0114235_100745 [Candidatus Kentron sp. FW]VFJ54261.1 MAG: hypothetical protein BECKFW1821B_GA0114236_101741 [Candidatus Kentron sp. FW]
MNSEIVSQAAEQMAMLPYRLQEKALKFITELNLYEQYGVSGQKLLKYAGFIPPDDLKIMRDVVENDCKKIDIDEW